MISEVISPVCQKLHEFKIEYMITGGLAFSCYCIPRFSRDIDVVINLKEPDMQPFLSIFSENYYCDESTVKDEFKRRGMFNVIHQKFSYKIDFIFIKFNEFEMEAFQRKKLRQVLDFNAWVISKEDLIISKLKWIQDLQSPLQISDIRELLELNDIDLDYIRYWIKNLKLKTFKLMI